MNGKVFTITGHLRGASENHSKLSQVPTLAQTLKINGINIVGALGRWNFTRAVVV